MNQEELLPGLLTRYRKIIPDWEDFLTCSTRSLPVSVRVNTLRIAPEALAERLAQKGFHLTPIPWADDLFVVEGTKVAKTIEHWLGLFYVQEAVQTVPVCLLDPRPGERVLDLCAAPGGKCTQIAVLMENRGLLVANEPNGRRQPSLLASLNRFGALNASVTSYRGESFPLRAGFDRVLVDAPCSAEGTLRKERSLRGGAFTATIERLVRLQRRLILRGYDLLRPGGRLVYSTCTFAPEENEAIAAFLLGERDATIEPISLPFASSPGVREWEGTIFPASITGCAGIYPHQIDSGGGFAARFRKPS
ncbi:NOL1/NOP2/sun family putative RNA methylase [Candidatus Bipolaricaulota bacterium]|nr:NOL1/NOP2/sun family putative RNA methylase [Candidatus Bipolaricaulota bacterium]